MNTPIEIKSRADMHTMCIRTHAPVESLKEVLGRSFGAIVQHVMGQGGQIIDGAYVAYFNMDMTNLDLEIGFPVAAPVASVAEIHQGKIEAGRFVTCLYTGPYEKMEPVYAAITQFINENGLKPTGTAYEFYLNGPETPPEELQTRIEFPLAD